ncbi:MAG TPA: tetratricopeptide repeat protein [Ktedonobacterales bacterium]
MRRVTDPISILSMSLAWLFCLGWLLNLGAALTGREQIFLLGGLVAGVLFGVEAVSALLLEFDHWRSYYGTGAFLRELLLLLLAGLGAWGITRVWPGLPTPLDVGHVAWLWGVLLLLLLAPYLAAQCTYLVLGEPLNFQRAMQPYYQRRWSEVIKTFVPLIKSHPRAQRPQLILAAAYFNLRQFDRARQLYKKMLEHDPQAPGAWQGLAELDFTSGAWDSAAEHYQHALEYAAFRRRGFILVGLGIALYKQNKPAEAATHLKKALTYPLSTTWRPIAAYALMRAARESNDTHTAERAMQSLALGRRAHKQFMDYWQAILNTSSSPLNTDYRAAVSLVDQLSW